MSVMNDIDPEKTGKFIAKLRADLNMTQEELGDKVFVTRKAVSKWETGAGCPSLDTLKRLTEVLGVSLEELVAGKFLDHRNLTNREIVLKALSSKHFKIISMVFSIFVLLLITIVVVFNLNADKIYLINYEDENFSLLNGILVLSEDNSYISIGNFYSAFSDVDSSTKFDLALYFINSLGDSEFILDLKTVSAIPIGTDAFSILKNAMDRKNDLFVHVSFVDKNNEEQEFDLKLQITKGSKLDKDKQTITRNVEANDSFNVEDGINLNFLLELFPDELKKNFDDKKISVDNQNFTLSYSNTDNVLKIASENYNISLSLKYRRIIIIIGDDHLHYIINESGNVILDDLEKEDCMLIFNVFAKLNSMI